MNDIFIILIQQNDLRFIIAMSYEIRSFVIDHSICSVHRTKNILLSKYKQDFLPLKIHFQKVIKYFILIVLVVKKKTQTLQVLHMSSVLFYKFMNQQFYYGNTSELKFLFSKRHNIFCVTREFLGIFILRRKWQVIFIFQKLW